MGEWLSIPRLVSIPPPLDVGLTSRRNRWNRFEASSNDLGDIIYHEEAVIDMDTSLLESWSAGAYASSPVRRPHFHGPTFNRV
jgi:hypothetical protein